MMTLWDASFLEPKGYHSLVHSVHRLERYGLVPAVRLRRTWMVDLNRQPLE